MILNFIMSKIKMGEAGIMDAMDKPSGLEYE